MAQELGSAGAFRGKFVEYGLTEYESGAVAVSVLAEIYEYWDAEAKEWVDCKDDEFVVRGDLVIVKKDKSINKNQAQALAQYTAWDCSLESITNQTWVPTGCRLDVQENEYQGSVRYRIAWINSWDKDPGGTGNVSAERATQLAAVFGSQLRALSGNASRNAAAPAGKPPAATGPKAPSGPKGRKKSSGPAPAATDTPDQPQGDAIPF